MLKRIEQGWMFTEEKLLEDFIWENLESTLDLIPLERQFRIQGEYADIIAKTKNNQLVVLELKNCEVSSLDISILSFFNNKSKYKSTISFRAKLHFTHSKIDNSPLTVFAFNENINLVNRLSL